MADEGSSEPKEHEIRKRDEIRVVLLGATGAGKSATGNSILGSMKFKENIDPQSGTLFSQTEVACLDDHPDIYLSVTDTPGLSSTGQDQNMICTQITQFIGQISPGPHVIVIVLSAGQRVSKEVQETVETFCKMFGDNSTEYMMFLFTHIDQLINSRFEETPVSIDQFVETLLKKDSKMRSIFKKCGNRYVGINNRLPLESKDHQQQIADLIKMFMEIMRKNGATYYTNDDFLEVEDKIMKPLDRKTGDRSKSRNSLGDTLLAFSAGGVTVGATCGAIGAMFTSKTALVAVGALVEEQRRVPW
ncbi:GTPase IMAP family member 9-like [Amphiura filiformis]|uniref:GTPase IMAP family member 9-like n=1 Tax=Amphiura filiformis TaxID=82378 RepID=UPI003B22167A